MSYLILLAYLVYIVLERRERKGLEKEEEPLVITGGVKTSRPTGIKILQALEPINIAVIEGSSKRYLPSNIDLTVSKRILELAGFDIDIYLQVKEEP